MPIPKLIGRGGNRHPIPLGFFVRDILNSGGPTWGSNLTGSIKRQCRPCLILGKAVNRLRAAAGAGQALMIISRTIFMFARNLD